MEEREVIDAQIAAEFGCDHRRARPHYKDAPGGGRGVWRQCPDCGEKMERLKVGDFSYGQLRQMPRLNEERHRQRWQAIQDRRRELWIEVRERRNDAWWAEYERYMRSEQWTEKRRRVLERERLVQGRPDPFCQACWKRAGVQGHHLTYVNFGHEPLWDLALVCLVCHGHLHPHRQEQSA